MTFDSKPYQSPRPWERSVADSCEECRRDLLPSPERPVSEKGMDEGPKTAGLNLLGVRNWWRKWRGAKSLTSHLFVII